VISRYISLKWLTFAWLLLHGTAMAASSGTVTGTIQFYQNNGNYCDVDTVSCTGTKYPESQYHTNQPIKNVKVYARRNSDNAIIGSGNTNSSGAFSFTWNDPSASGDVVGQVIWRGEHRDGRFRLNTTSNGFWVFSSANATFTNGGTTAKGTMVWGNSSTPSALANVYDGASKMWENSLSQSSRMNSYFTDITITTWASATNASGKSVNIDNSVAYNNHQAVMHEMGHSASYLSSRDQSFRPCTDYCYPSTGSSCGWGRHTEEWGAPRFEEAVATHLATVGLYLPTATAPFYCPSSGPCTSAIDNLETTVTCTAADMRHPHDLMRYFWDTYGPSGNHNVWEIIDTINAWDNGTGEKQKDEPWDNSSALDDRDGRSGQDFVGNWTVWGVNSSALLNADCGDAGDY